MTNRLLTSLAVVVGIGALLATGLAAAQSPGMGNMGEFRAQHREDMQKVRDQHRADMQAQMAENGWTCPGFGNGPGNGPGAAPGKVTAPTETPTK